VATEITILHNFLLQERFVFGTSTNGHYGWRSRLLQFAAFNNVETALRLPLLVLVVSRFTLNAVVAQGLTLAVAFTARFLFVSRVTYRSRRPQVGSPTGAPTTELAI